MRFLLSGGGTAGHVHPALTVADVLRASGHEVAFAGTAEGAEARLSTEAGHDFHVLPARGWDRSRPWTLVAGIAVMAWSALRAWALLARLRPDCVLGFGGYVSIPVGIAAWMRDVPLVLQEQNAVPGLANRFLSRWARAVAVAYRGSAAHLRHPERATLAGMPVRPAVLAGDGEAWRVRHGIPSRDTLLFVFGGSRGARHLNEATVALFGRLLALPGVSVAHVAGRVEADAVNEAVAAHPHRDASRYHVLDYEEDMGSALAAADLVVCRSGASSVAEVIAVGRAAVLVPYPYATDDHQTLNASEVVEAGGAVLVRDADLDGPEYADAVLGLLADRERRQRMAAAAARLGVPDAAARVAALACQAATGKVHGE
ncbi:MAG: undecaprenyldiphospho-muramoylpentapeptide beta-N-acetylglucosaminyltransferase [Actinobacteria bacterium]|nr:MAG: undecaprenyldiphospho-muramoylpentapeptide beta-N-acetylglucosaminyltransferase [Actinomycetota bacterium]